MGWTTPITFKPGEYAHAALPDSLQEQVSDNLQYLKDNKADIAAAQSSPTRVMNTIYHNTSGKARLVKISIYIAENDYGRMNIQVGASSPPTTVIGSLGRDSTPFHSERFAMLFCVPSGYYYESVGDHSKFDIEAWVERDLGA